MIKPNKNNNINNMIEKNKFLICSKHLNLKTPLSKLIKNNYLTSGMICNNSNQRIKIFNKINKIKTNKT